MWLLRIGSDRYTRTLSVVALFVLVLGLVAPTTAWASEGEEEHTGFIAGLETLVNPESVKVEETDSTPESEYLDSYEPVLVEVRSGDATNTVDGNASESVYDSIVSWVTMLRIPWGAGGYGPTHWHFVAQRFLVTVVVPSALLLVFMWWGVRKAVRMIKSAWYKGHASV